MGRAARNKSGRSAAIRSNWTPSASLNTSGRAEPPSLSRPRVAGAGVFAKPLRRADRCDPECQQGVCSTSPTGP
ncbi:MAG: hypothetical protein ACRDSO_08110, partial [Pseudonocardiaceae bacterium]